MTSATRRLSRVSTAIALSFALAAAPAFAAGYLKLGDIKGESADKGHGGQIEIQSWSWGESQSGGSMTLKGSNIGENSPGSRPGTAIGGAIAGHANDGNEAARKAHDKRTTWVEREMKESGEKGGTEDINIGVGELQEMTISKSADKASPKLLEPAVKGKVFKEKPMTWDNTTQKAWTALATPAPKGTLTAVVPAGMCAVGARYPTAELGTGDRVYVMENVVVASCSASTSGGSGSDMRPMESISLNYERIK